MTMIGTIGRLDQATKAGPKSKSILFITHAEYSPLEDECGRDLRITTLGPQLAT